MDLVGFISHFLIQGRKYTTLTKVLNNLFKMNCWPKNQRHWESAEGGEELTRVQKASNEKEFIGLNHWYLETNGLIYGFSFKWFSKKKIIFKVTDKVYITYFFHEESLIFTTVCSSGYSAQNINTLTKYRSTP